jgi:UDP-3-O-[3-hydroxymyristoyl] N-acetylglucosamine deacetylase/3-hydroxyacyl-[acyl-carrier-protein] dehydratase
VCRTFVFFHEVQFLASQGLVKGGDVDNAIVVVEHPVDDATVAHMAELFGQPKLSVTPEGYLSNLVLNFPDECGRHKLLDLIGDIRLAGGYLRAHINAYKPGHTINTNAAKAVQKLI